MKLYSETELMALDRDELVEAYLELVTAYEKVQNSAMQMAQNQADSINEIISRLAKAGHLDDLGDMLQWNVHTNKVGK